MQQVAEPEASGCDPSILHSVLCLLPPQQKQRRSSCAGARATHQHDTGYPHAPELAPGCRGGGMQPSGRSRITIIARTRS